MSVATDGIHHVTAIASDPRRNVEFYRDVLGLRLVKRTVNFDDPATLHLSYGDSSGRPGTIITFFVWPGARRGRRGSAQAAAVAFTVPLGSVGYWIGRLVERRVRFEGPVDRFGERVISFEGPDGLGLELVASRETEKPTPEVSSGEVPAEHAIRGLHGVTLWEEDVEKTRRILEDVLGFEPSGSEAGNAGERFRYTVGEGTGVGRVVDVRRVPEGWEGVEAAGSVHHVAFRAADDAHERDLRQAAARLGLEPTPVRDRHYFRSVYFREPGGALFEIATDGPGLTADEDPGKLGSELKLPPRFESDRARYEALLPAMEATGRGEVGTERGAMGFIHRFVPAVHDGPRASLLLLHGTGGDEGDLLQLGEELAPGAAMLSPRGKVREDGRPRFFGRSAEGVIDQEDLKFRTGELARFVEAASGEYGLDPANLVAVGYSNGANVAASLMLLHPGLLQAAILLRATVPFEPEAMPNLAGTAVYLAVGRQDESSTPQDTQRLAEVLSAAGAEVELQWSEVGHGLIRGDVDGAKEWLSGIMGTRATPRKTGALPVKQRH